MQAGEKNLYHRHIPIKMVFLLCSGGIFLMSRDGYCWAIFFRLWAAPNIETGHLCGANYIHSLTLSRSPDSSSGSVRPKIKFSTSCTYLENYVRIVSFLLAFHFICCEREFNNLSINSDVSHIQCCLLLQCTLYYYTHFSVLFYV